MKCSRGYLAAVVFLVVAFSADCPARGQQYSIPPRCTERQLRFDPIFLNGPGDIFTLAFDVRNLSSQTCLLLAYPGLGLSPADRASGQRPFVFHESLPRDRANAVLKGGEVVNFSYQWKTVSEDQPDRCFALETANMGYEHESFYIEAPELLGRVCSDIESSTYQTGPFLPRPETREAFQLATPDRPLYEGDRFYLQVTSASATLPELKRPAGSPASLPGVYLWQRSPDGRNDFRRARPWYFACCRPGRINTRFDASPSSLSIDSGASLGAGDYTAQIYVQSPGKAAGDSPVQFQTSNVVTLHVQDPAGIRWLWGPRTRGVAMAISLDQSTYATGEQIPIHLAAENFAADVPVHGSMLGGDPMYAFGLRLLDSDGNAIDEVDGDPGWGISDGWPISKEFPRGKIFPVERSVFGLQPGSYTVVGTWCAYIGSDKECTPVEAKTTLRVLPSGSMAETKPPGR